ncbi:DUF1156 domain-containing protein [Halobacterium rubrum]|uniref:DUF1156 domain-containing protein n=1 Tax=Halobacterium TaxID=2239 RepID=UPI001F3166B9|nr:MULTISPECIES: DUF1156 domain-containing protein [Halobacterium]MDH5020355.1 DUF1156 domain-containing protein [Halobacterium rubrum]
MSEQSDPPQGRQERTELPIERGFPIELVNDIGEKEGRAKQWYRPIYTMHKWWARRLGCVFRAVSLYSLLDNESEVQVSDPSQENEKLDSFSSSAETIHSLVESVSLDDPVDLWELYPKDVNVEGKRVLDPFMGGGTSLVEASRFGAEVVGNDLNPVAWFITKKELEAGQANVEKLEQEFGKIQDRVASKITQYYETTCPNGGHRADVMYYLWAKELDCTSCGEMVPLFNDFRVGKGRYDNKDKYHVYCPECESVILVDDWREECTCDCGYTFVPEEGTVSDGKYSCRSCGQRYGIIDRIGERGGFDKRLYAIEYYCPTCDNEGRDKEEIKSYKPATDDDRELYQAAKTEWENSEDLTRYVPDGQIPVGIKTDSSAFDGGIGGGFNVLKKGYEKWEDMFNSRQLLCLSSLLKEIDQVEDKSAREYLLLAFTESLNYNSMMIGYNAGRNHSVNMFNTNSFDPPHKPAEGNVWGTEYGIGTFQSTWKMIIRGCEYGRSPTERYMKYPKEDGKPEFITDPSLSEPDTVETGEFKTSIGRDFTLHCGDMRDLETEELFDAVITDPPYYDNVIYSELSNYFYVWQRLILQDEYGEFESELTNSESSIVANPAEGKGAEEFESEIKQGFANIKRLLKDDGVLSFTYHHSDSESWGELLEALCDVGFEVTATYPISADQVKFGNNVIGKAVSFDILVVARPTEETTAMSWDSLRREIYRTARRTRRRLEEDRNLSQGDIGVMEMGDCFREYSKHHGKVQRDGEIMSAKDVVQEIYGIIQDASDIGVEDVYVDLLDTDNPSYDDVNKLCRGTNATPEELKEMRLYNQDDGFELGTWDNEKRQAYIQERVNGDDGEHLSNLDKLQFLRYRYEKGQSVQNYVEKWDVNDDLRELAGRLADVTGDETYTRVLGDRDITSY